MHYSYDLDMFSIDRFTHIHVLNAKLFPHGRVISYGGPYTTVFIYSVDSECDLVMFFLMDAGRLVCVIDGPSSLSEILGLQWIDEAHDE